MEARLGSGKNPGTGVGGDVHVLDTS
jgi:hypothetical protein